MREITIHFFLDFISPFGYLAQGRFADIVRRFGAQVCYHPVDLRIMKSLVGNTGPSNRDIPAKLRYLTNDLHRWATRYDITMVRELSGERTGQLNTGLLLARDKLQPERYVQVAWDCVWGRGMCPADPGTLSQVANRMGWVPEELLGFVKDSGAEQRYRRETTFAVSRGVFGVPTFMVGDEMWWGNDRLDFLEEYLKEGALQSD